MRGLFLWAALFTAVMSVAVTAAIAEDVFIEGGGHYEKVHPSLLNQSADVNPPGSVNFNEIRKSEFFQKILGGVGRIGLKLPTWILPEGTWAGIYVKKPLNAVAEFDGIDNLTGTLINKKTELSQISAGGFLRYYVGEANGLKPFAEAYFGLGKISYEQVIKGNATSTLLAKAILLESGVRLGTDFPLSDSFYGQIAGGYHIQTSQPFVVENVSGSAYTTALKKGDRLALDQGGAKTDLRAILNGVMVYVTLGLLL